MCVFSLNFLTCNRVKLFFSKKYLCLIKTFVIYTMSESDLRLENVELKNEIHKNNSEGELISVFDENSGLAAGNEENKTTRHVQELLHLWKHYTAILPTGDKNIKSVAAELCDLLVKTHSLDALSVFLDALPDSHDYNCNESIVRAKIHVALNKKDTKTVYSLIQENQFTDGDNLIPVWDEARYLDEERRTKKKLTPLSRFRVRKRYPPPKTICVSGIRKTNTLPREATSYLKTWLMNHIVDPYPSASDKQHLAEISGLSQAQVKTWFANARRRSKNTEEFQQKSGLSGKTISPSCTKSFSVCSPSSSYESSTYPNHDHTHYGESHYEEVHAEYASQPEMAIFYEHAHPFNTMDRQGYNRCEHGNHVTDPYDGCNNMRPYCSLEQSHCQYDTTRVLYDLATRGGYHHYDYSHATPLHYH
ncbi:homeobox protein six1a-like [Hydractinia symbiolongicarpus]|uniref:homeobox protein six1a-like n=1 Tax=Hydractinia symbiolongicarpus TaxID=13093 RepID=UPI00255136A2|nr:homeobox protein six1a-like [Hydractinia symbiolongicarpus]